MCSSCGYTLAYGGWVRVTVKPKLRQLLSDVTFEEIADRLMAESSLLRCKRQQAETNQGSFEFSSG